MHTVKEKEYIISDNESESEIKDADNEENTVDLPINSLFFTCFIIVFRSGYYKKIIGVNIFRKNFLLQFEEVGQ